MPWAILQSIAGQDAAQQAPGILDEETVGLHKDERIISQRDYYDPPGAYLQWHSALPPGIPPLYAQAFWLGQKGWVQR